ncbi:hypothetical protein KRP22_010159 [Phytophthora ramorum]|nr:Guanidinoacetate N-methyltransferase [Phytophthora ramorum]
MTTQGNVKGLDELGQEILWSSRGQQVMMRWEMQYMELCVDALVIQPTDRVLEIGFGLAYSASRIQTFRPKSHTIIECDRETLHRAQQFAFSRNGVEIVAGTWQQQLPTLDQFDCVFFDDYPLPELESGDLHGNGGGSSRQRSRWHKFLDVALKHCAVGARISGYLARELDLHRPGCQAAVTRVQVDIPENCNYFPHKTALVPVITVVDPVAAAGGCSAGVESPLPLPFSSTKFQRAFDIANLSGQVEISNFAPERGQIDKIREFLLAHEMDALSYEQSGEFEDKGGEIRAMEDGVHQAKNSVEGGGHHDEGVSRHYSDAQSRRDFLQTLRRKAAASKQMFG